MVMFMISRVSGAGAGPGWPDGRHPQPSLPHMARDTRAALTPLSTRRPPPLPSSHTSPHPLLSPARTPSHPQFEVNYFGVQYTIAAALAGTGGMAAPLADPATGKPVRRAILVTASAATHFSQPAASHYSAAKYAVRGLLNSVRAEYVLQRKHLTFHMLTPWYVKTPMIAYAHGSDPNRTETLKVREGGVGGLW